MHYAKDTAVPVERSKAEIETTLIRYGASKFISGWSGSQAMIGFEMQEKQIRFVLPLPDPQSAEFTHYKQGYRLKCRSETEARKKWEQACRQRWRAMNLCIKAKLEAVECGITSFEEEFLPHFVVPGSGGKTFGEIAIPQLRISYQSGKPLPPLLGHG